MSENRIKELAGELAVEISKEIKNEVKHLGKKTFNMGGVHPEANKFAHSKSVETFDLPDQAVVYMTQHLGAPAKPVVQVGDKVKVGQLVGEANGFVSANIHAPISGTVTKIDAIADITGYKKPAVVIKREGDEWDESIDTSEEIVREIKLGKEEIIARMKDRGIVGLGGACFPTHIKYMLKPEQKCEYLIINAAECEPYISTDNRVVLERTEQCIIGIEIALIASGADQAVIGIEDNKPNAIAKLTEAVHGHPKIRVQPLRIKYPQGAEKQLIKAITGRSVPNGALPISVGCIVNNITTMYVLYQAVQKNKPIIQAYTTVSGKSLPLEKCKNFRIRLGTPIRDIMNAVGIPEDTGKIIAGGPMMGKAVANMDACAGKGMSSLLFLSEKEAKRGPVSNCLRCGKCVEGCPMGLEPYLLHALSDLQRYEDCEKNGIMNCIECGSCQYICPSNRPILDYIRVGKNKTGAMIRARAAQNK
ncbi:MAG: electron transport complex subunit RsxC [Bacteroidales bacterium]|jgi:electron transport complex protein RnfC|nr:electron transport complex subunit RsxC [Bacteroidales bacterium]